MMVMLADSWPNAHLVFVLSNEPSWTHSAMTFRRMARGDMMPSIPPGQP